jgi:uroporphyrinogen decarboxylase
MNARENALRIIRFDHPQRVVSDLPLYELSYHGCNHEGFEGGAPGLPGGDDSPVGSKWFDIWGTGWHKLQPGVMAMPVVHPLDEVANLKRYRWPEAHDERICGRIYEMADGRAGEDQFLAGSHRDTLWEKAYMLVGMERMMVAFYREPGFAREVLHRIIDFQLGIAEHYIRLGVELVKLGDDLGTQSGPLLGPRTVESFLMPEYERLCRLYREHGAIIWFHCCGHVASVIEPLMRLGVQVLHPVQATANDLEAVRSMTAGRMALQGGVSSVTVMDGPVDRITRETKERIWQLGQDGGYFCGPDQSLPYPEAHLQALEEVIDAYGRYPLSPPPV